MRSGVLATVLILTSACSLNPHPMIILVNPTTGQSVTCQYEVLRLGLLAGIEGKIAVENCAEQYENLGFVRSENLKGKVALRPAPGSGLNGTFTGELSGTYLGQAFGMRVTFTLVQSGDRVVGVWNTSGGASGVLNGAIRGKDVSEFQAKQLNPCEGAFTGAASIESDGAQLRGSYSGDDCNGTVAASFVVRRQ